MSFKQKVSAKYGVVSKVQGFAYDSLRNEDVVDALHFYEGVFDVQVPIEVIRNWKNYLKVGSVEEIDPRDFVDISAHTRNKKGWLLESPEEDWSSELKSEYSRDFAHILDQRKRGVLPPAVAIDHEFGDGLGRTLLQYALGEKVPVINLVPTAKWRAAIQASVAPEGAESAPATVNLEIEEVDRFPPEAIKLIPKDDSLRQHINNPNTVEQGWVAKLAGKIVGLVVIVTAASQGHRYLENTKFLEIVVDPKQRGKGIGEKLLKTAIADANDPPEHWAGFTHHSEGFKKLSKKFGIRDNDDISRYEEDDPAWNDDGTYG